MNNTLEICEVAPRDGLQSASHILSVDARISFISQLMETGLTKIEVGSLVNPKLVPAMADSDAVYIAIAKKFPQYKKEISLLVPNQRGLDRALEIGCTSIAFFSATSETFNKKNINRGVTDSIAELKLLIAQAQQAELHIRLYISTVFDCAYQGTMHPLEDLKPFLPLFNEVDEISLGDTTGKATKAQVKELIDSKLLKSMEQKIWWHFHDTYQLAEENARFCMQQGFRKFDSSAGGIGGCPFSPGAKGNIATEKVIFIAQELGVQHGIRLPLPPSSPTFHPSGEGSLQVPSPSGRGNKGEG